MNSSISGMSGSQDIFDILILLNNRTYGNSGFTSVGGATATVKTVKDVDYSINGKVFTKAATASIALTACPVQPAGTTYDYLVSVDASGNVTCTMGLDIDEYTKQWSPVRPSLPADNAPLGYFTVTTDDTHTFTAGTTNLNAAGLTITYYALSTALLS
ncbi:hypothetical protein [Candidatus Magnetobacterium casense]|uniref:Uncharacterized protein n=1 Tax=Candidatus Magnetobacterium casense TaxID=1455061 RepID=A0ABS6S105_9BACT|nr:hypothetical protein [Candidatus Magnetobacterium casensis]MBV6342491.1 hypothetical protein [Candidatus Magnetobacterium casensis]